MRKLTPVDLKPWTLPLIVVALVLPITAAALLTGAVGAFVAGAIVATIVVVIAILTQFEEEIEVARARDDRYHVLIAATEPLEDMAALDEVTETVERGRRALAADRERDPDILVLAPALNRPLAHWASDLREARHAAQERLTISLARLAAAGLDARGEVGDTDPVQAVEDALRVFPAHEVVFISPRDGGHEAVGEIRKRLDRPVYHVEVSRSAG